MENGQVILDKVIIPYTLYKGEKYYPIKYVFEKFLLKSNMQLHKKDEYKPYIQKLLIDWNFKNTVPQEGTCMSINGWNLYVNSCKVNCRKNENKISRWNIWCDFIGNDTNKINNEEPIYDEYTLDCIKESELIHKDCELKKCTNCNRELPKNEMFFGTDKRTTDKYTSTCRRCLPIPSEYNNGNDTKRDIFIKFGFDGYNLYNKDVIKFYFRYVENSDYTLKIDKNKIEQIVMDICKEKVLNNEFNIDKDISKENLINYFKNNVCGISNKYIHINKIIEYITEEDCKIRPYKYSHYTLGSIDVNTARVIINTYLLDNNIYIKNIFTYNYQLLLKKCRLTQFLNDILSFIVKYYNYEYAGYKFKISSSNYYKNINNRIFDMKYLIEKDLKLQIEKIPLYITKTFLHENYSPLYYALNKKCYEGNLFKWINQCYPSQFEEQDFNINKYRIEFDSMEEGQVDRILREYCSNVIYNIRNSKNEVTIMDMKPDWIIISPTKGTYLVEYFGMYLQHGGTEYKERIEKYKNKTEIKFKKYGELMKFNYKHLYIFPEDIKNNFEGLLNKINHIHIN